MDSDTQLLLALLLRQVSGRRINALLDSAARRERRLAGLHRLTVPELLEELGPDAGHAAAVFAGIDEDAVAEADTLARALDAREIRLIPRWHELWPRSADALGDARPPLLFALGNTDLLGRPAVAIVGSRKATDEGLAMAGTLAEGFARQARPVVSGGAAGVDTSAFRHAVEAGGQVIAVLPYGLRKLPKDDVRDQALQDGRVLLLSAVPPDSPWKTHQALERNALIGALARLVFVVEPNNSGGSLRAGKDALELGRPVAVYGDSRGVAALVEGGALHLRDLSDPGEMERLTQHLLSPNLPPALQGELFG